jgi:hypothetical protein
VRRGEIFGIPAKSGKKIFGIAAKTSKKIFGIPTFAIIMGSVLCLEEARRVEDPSLCKNTMQARRRRTSAIIKWLEITKFLFEARSRLVL